MLATLHNDFWDEQYRILDEERCQLETPFTELKLHDAIFSFGPSGPLDQMGSVSFSINIFGQ
jgi:hypothetical protein